MSNEPAWGVFVQHPDGHWHQHGPTHEFAWQAADTLNTLRNRDGATQTMQVRSIPQPRDMTEQAAHGLNSENGAM